MSDRLEEVEAIRRRVEASGEKDPDGGHWLELVCAKELGIEAYERVWIHTTRREKFVRFEKDGTIGHNRRGVLIGAKGHPRMVRVRIGGVGILRHRAMALAAGIMTLEQYRDTKNFVIDHVKPRKKDAVPDDRPENLRVVPPSENKANPMNAKSETRATGRPVTLMRKTPPDAPVDSGGDAERPRFCEHLTFQSAIAAAKFLGVNKSSLCQYLNGSKRQKSMPEKSGAEWDAMRAKVEGFACEDATRIPGVPEGDDRRISPTKGLLRALDDGTYAHARNVSTDQGYLVTRIGGKSVRVHRLVFETFKRAEFDAELAKMPPGTDERKLHIDHIDGDKLNNALANLRAVDTTVHNGKHSAAIRWIDDDGETLGTYATASEAARAVRGTDGKTLYPANILRVCNGDCAHTGGRKFAYVDSEHAKELAAARAEKKRKIDEVYETAHASDKANALFSV